MSKLLLPKLNVVIQSSTPSQTQRGWNPRRQEELNSDVLSQRHKRRLFLKYIPRRMHSQARRTRYTVHIYGHTSSASDRQIFFFFFNGLSFLFRQEKV